MANKDNQALVSLQSWLEGNNLLEPDASPETFKKGVAWFKRHIKEVPVFSPKNGIYFVNAKLASSVYEKHMKSLNVVLQNKQLAALKLSAKNMGIRIAVRANFIKKKSTAEERRLFWASKEGCELYNYCLQIVLLKKPALQPANYTPCKTLTLHTNLNIALKPEERLEAVTTLLEIDWGSLKNSISKPIADKVGFISNATIQNKPSFLSERRNSSPIAAQPSSADLDASGEDEGEAVEEEDQS